MSEKEIACRFVLKPSVIARIKAAGFNRFNIGLYLLLTELDELRGATTKLQKVVDTTLLAPRGSGSLRAALDPGNPASLENTNARKARLYKEHQNSPEVRKAVYRGLVLDYLSGPWGSGDGDLSGLNIPAGDTPNGVPTYNSWDGGVWQDYITQEEFDACTAKRLGRYSSAPDTEDAEIVPTFTLKLSPAALGFMVRDGKLHDPSWMNDEQVRELNAEFEEGGAYHNKHDHYAALGQKAYDELYHPKQATDVEWD